MPLRDGAARLHDEEAIPLRDRDIRSMEDGGFPEITIVKSGKPCESRKNAAY